MRPLWAAMLACALGCGSLPGPAEAGLLDLLFGPRATVGGPAPAPAATFRPVEPGDPAHGRRASAPAAPRVSSGRQVCVRLCDGFYYPLDGVASRRGSGQSDCESSCPGTAMAVFKVSGDNVEDATDGTGQRYGDLANAFSYRKAVASTCSCQRAGSAMQALAHDMTLRAGDIVVTNTGALVFRAGGDFTDIRAPKALSASLFAQADRVIGFAFREEQARRGATLLADRTPAEITVTPLRTGSIAPAARAEAVSAGPRVVLPQPLVTHDDLSGNP